MNPVIKFEFPERVWEQSQFGLLLRINAYYTLLPYIFSHHNNRKFRSAQDYAAFEAYEDFLWYSQDLLVNPDEVELRLNLIEEYEKRVKKFRENISDEEIGEGSPAFCDAFRKNAKPNAPSFDSVLHYRKLKNPENILWVQRNESAIHQREMVSRFCMLVCDLLHIQNVKLDSDSGQKKLADQDQTFLEERISKVKLPKTITKEFVFEVFSQMNDDFVNEKDFKIIMKEYSAVAPLMFALAGNVAWEHDMKDYFVSNLSMIILRYKEMYDVLVNKVFKHGREVSFTAANIYELALPSPPDCKLPKRFIKRELVYYLSDSPTDYASEV